MLKESVGMIVLHDQNKKAVNLIFATREGKIIHYCPPHERFRQSALLTSPRESLSWLHDENLRHDRKAI